MKKALLLLLLPMSLFSMNNQYDLINLAENNNAEGIQIAIQQGANPNESDSQGFTALHVAAWNGYTDIVQTLLTFGANPNIMTKSGSTPLRFANTEISNLLISFGAYAKQEIPDVPAFSSSTNVYIQYLLPAQNNAPVQYQAREYQQPQPTLLPPQKESTQKRAAVTQVISNFITNSYYYTNVVDAYPKKSYNILIDSTPLDVSLLYKWDGEGNNALHRAAKEGDLDTIVTLIEQGVNPFSKNNNGDTALRFAIQEQKLDVAQYLIEEIGLDVNDENNQGTSAVVFAALNNDTTTIEYLTQMGANINSPATAVVDRTVDGETRTSTVSNWSSLMAASQVGNNDAIQSLIDGGADINGLDSDGWNALLFAVQNGYLETAQLLIELGIDYNVESRDKHTALSLAIDNNDTPMIDFLSNLGAAASSVPRIQVEESTSEYTELVDVESYEYYDGEYTGYDQYGDAYAEDYTYEPPAQ